MSEISRRVQSIEESSTLKVDAKAKELRAAGESVIGFGAGEPDFPSPAHVVEAAQRAAADPRMHRYSPAAGLPELRDAIVEATRRNSGLEAVREQVVVTNGGKHALYAVFQALIDPGDEVILPAPYWVSYPEQVVLAGGEVRAVPTTPESGFLASVDDLEAARSERTKALIFVSPSNPTGAVYPAERVREIGGWAAEHGIWVITDEIYEHLVYGGAEAASMPVLVPELADRCIVVNGVAKTYAMTGWRVGWIVAPREFAAAATRLQSHLTSNVANVAQAAALAAITGPQGRVEEMRQAFDRRRRTTVDRLRRIDGVVCPEPHGAFYVFPDLRATFDRVGVSSALDLAEKLLDERRVAVVPGDGFGGAGCVRISYALGDAELEEGLDRLADWLG